MPKGTGSTMDQINFIPPAAVAELLHLVRSLAADYRARRNRARFFAMLEERRKDRESARKVREVKGAPQPYAY